MIFIAAAWIGFALLFIGLGMFGFALFRFSMRDAGTLQTAFLCLWVGWCLSIAFLQVWHLVRPVNIAALGVLGGLSLVGWWLGRQRVFAWARKRSWKRFAIGVLASLAAGVGIESQVIRLPLIYDTLLYHWQATLWNSKYPIVLGLANLHDRFGFNSSHFLYTALVDFGPLTDYSVFFANAFLAWALLMYLVFSAGCLLRKPKSLLPHIFDLLLIPAALDWVMGDATGSYSPDWPTFAVGVMLASQLFHWMWREPDQREDAFTLVVLSLLAAVGVTIKLSFGVFGGAFWLFALLLWVKKNGTYRNAWCEWKTWLTAIGVWFGVAGVWAARGIILSGYPFYPISFLGFPVAWKISITRVYYQQALILGFAREVGSHWTESLFGWDWFPNWLLYFSSISTTILGTIGIVFLVSIVWIRLRKKNHLSLASGSRPAFSRGLFLLPPGIGAIAWFISGPAIRFSGSIFWVFYAGGITLIYDHLCHHLQKFRRMRVALVYFSIAFVYLCVTCVNFRWIQPEWSLPKNVSMEMKTGSFEPVSIDAVTVYVANWSELCFNHPILCTPTYNSGLRLFTPGSVKKGFWSDPNLETPFHPGLDGKGPLGADIISGLVFDPQHMANKMENFAHILIYSDKKMQVQAAFFPWEIKEGDQKITSIPLLIRVNGKTAYRLTMQAGKPVDEKLDLVPGANEFTLLLDPGEVNMARDNTRDLSASISTITFH
jgi:hypothetical protein